MIKLFSVKVQTGRWLMGAAMACPCKGVWWHNSNSPMLFVLFLQDKQKKEAAAAAAGKPKQSAGELRLNKGRAGAAQHSSGITHSHTRCCWPHLCLKQSCWPLMGCPHPSVLADLTELSLPSNISIKFPEGKEKPMHFEITIKPDEGCYRSGKFLFDFQISTGYPYDAPKVKCKTKVGWGQSVRSMQRDAVAAAVWLRSTSCCALLHRGVFGVPWYADASCCVPVASLCAHALLSQQQSCVGDCAPSLWLHAHCTKACQQHATGLWHKSPCRPGHSKG
jgi:hypothetical protein